MDEKLDPPNVPAKTSGNTVAKKVGKPKKPKKQKGRIKFFPLLMAVLVLVALFLALVTFRNVIARKVITAGLEGAFGAKVEIKDLDIDILHTRFMLDGVKIANKQRPMSNLVEVGRFELFFDLGALTRGKVIANNVQVTGVTMNTARKTSGALPPKKKKAKEGPPNPYVEALKAEVNKVTSGINVGAGVQSVKNRLDPVAFLEDQKASLKTPVLVQKVTDEVPVLTEKWTANWTKSEAQVNTFIAQGKEVAAIDFKNIRTVEQVQELLGTLNRIQTSAEEATVLGESLAKDVRTDINLVVDLGKETATALQADRAQLKSLIDSITGFDGAAASNLISSLISTFIYNSLGTALPYIQQGASIAATLKETLGNSNTNTMQAKANRIERAKGRNLTFNSRALPKVHFKNIALSAYYGGIAASARVQHLTNNQYIVGLPVMLDLRGTGGGMVFSLGGTVDVRQTSPKIVHFDVGAGGFSLGIPGVTIPGGFAFPSVKGVLNTTAAVEVSRDKTVMVNAGGTLADAVLTAAPFEPAYFYDIYNAVLADITSLNLNLFSQVKDGRFSMQVTTDTDKQIAAAMQKQLAVQIERLKAEVRTRAEAYLEELKVKYSSEINTFTSYTDKIVPIIKDLQDFDGLVERKKAEAEARLKELANEKLNEAKDRGVQEAAKALDNAPLPDKAKEGLGGLIKKIPGF